MDLLVVGLDGLSYNMLDRFDVEFDALDRVRTDGIAGDLMSVDTPTTGPAWTSFATGKDPGTHGVHNMKEYAPDYQVHPVGVNATEAAAYDLIDDALFVNLPASDGRLPQAQGTYVVSSILSGTKDDTTPPPLQELESYPDYIPHHDPTKKTRPGEYLDHVIEIAESRTRFAREAFETHDPRLGFVLYSTPDWAGHILSRLASEERRGEFYRTLIETVDSGVSELLECSDNVVLMSDHGFERKHGTVHVADWLRDNGYLVEGGRSRDATLADVITEWAVDLGSAFASRSDRFYRLARLVYNRLLGTDIGARLQNAAQPDPEFPGSQAWGLRYGCVYVNDDRYESPTVADPDRVRREIRDGLSEITRDGDPVFRDVLLPEEAYADPTARVPDVIARPAPGYHAITHWSPTGGYTSPTDSYEHRYRGIVAASGPLFDEGTVEGMSIVDILPTIMAALDVPLAPDFDGEVRSDVLAGNVEPTLRAPDDVPQPRMEPTTEADETERSAAVRKRLADLGYME